MKKFLVSILILIPVIVLLALAATGGLIKMSIKVEAKDIIIKDFSNKELPLDETYFLDLVGQDCLEVAVQVIPAISYNLNVIFRSTEESEGHVQVERLGSTPFYRIFPSDSGVCDLLVIAENNEEVKKTIHFYITTNELSEKEDSLIVLTDENRDLGGQVLNLDETYNLTGPARLFLDCYPVESIGNNRIYWTAEDKDIVSIDQNGAMYPTGLGVTQVSAQVTDKAEKMHTFSLRVSTLQAIAKVDKIYLTENNLTLDYILNNVLLQKDLTVQKIGDKFNVYNSLGQLVKIIHFEKVEAAEAAILNKDYLSTIYIGTGGQQVQAGYLDFDCKIKPEGLSFLSSNTSLVQVDEQGILTPLQQGQATIKVFLNGQLLDSQDIKISARAATFRLTRDNQSNRVGIKQEYVWAYNWLNYDSNNKSVLNQEYSQQLLYSRLEEHINHTYKGIKYAKNSARHIADNGKKVPIEDISLYWSVDNANYAATDQQGNLTFYKTVCGNEVTVLAFENINGIKTRQSRRYTFKFIEDETAINVENIAEFRGVNEGYALSTVLHSNVVLDPNKPAWSPFYLIGEQKFSIRANVYGNGKILQGKKGRGYDRLIDITLQGQYLDYSKNIEAQLQPLMIENLEIDGWDASQPYEEANVDNLIQDMIGISYYYNYKNKYFNYQKNEHLDEPDTLRDLRLAKAKIKFRYCYLHNAVKGINFREMSNAEIEGTIFANMGLSAINLEQYYSNFSTLTINRVVIRDTAGIGISSILYDNNSRMNSNANPPAKIIIKGFFDAYTWAPIDGFGSLGKVFPRENLDGLPAGINADAVYSMIEVGLRDIMKQMIEQSGLTLFYNGKKYAHLAILSLGLWANSDPNRITDETGLYKKVIFKFDKKSVFKTEALPIPFNINMLEAMLGVEDLTKKSVVVSYDLTKTETPLLPDANCPSNATLYQKLQGVDV